MNPLSKRVYTRVCEVGYGILDLPNRNAFAKSISEYSCYGSYLFDNFYPRVTYLDLWKDAYTPARSKYGIHMVLALAGLVTFYEIRATAQEAEQAKAEKLARKA